MLTEEEIQKNGRDLLLSRLQKTVRMRFRLMCVCV